MNVLVREREDKTIAADGAKQPRLRLALVSGSYDYIKDGIALTLNRLVGFLLSNGVEVLVFAPVGPRPALEHAGKLVRVPSVPLPLRPEYRVALGLPRLARREMERFRPHLVHIAVPDLLGRSALHAARTMRVPVVASYHTRYETYLKHYGLELARPFLERYLKTFYNSCRELYVPSQSMADELKNQGITAPMPLWQRGVDSNRFDPKKRSSAWRARIGVAANEPVVLFVSRLVREKQLSTLADVLRRLASTGVPHRSVVVGDGPERARLERALPATHFTGFLDGDELATAYASSDVFLFPSCTESFGNVTLEAMASGLPTVCADATGSRTLVLSGVTGVLVAEGAPEGFVSALARLLVDEKLRSQLGGAARARSLEFNWDAPMQLLLERYRALAA